MTFTEMVAALHEIRPSSAAHPDHIARLLARPGDQLPLPLGTQVAQ